MAGYWISLGSVVSQIVYENGSMWIVFVSTRIRIDCDRVEFFQPVYITSRVDVGIFFVILNSNPILT